MSDIVDEKDFLGSKKVIVGNGKSDIVLNTYGNIWIRTGKKTVKLSEYFPSTNPSKIITIVDDIDNSTKENGMFYYDSSKDALYASINNKIIPLSNVDIEEEKSDNTTQEVSKTEYIENPYEHPSNIELNSLKVKNLIFENFQSLNSNMSYNGPIDTLEISSSINIPNKNNKDLYITHIIPDDTEDLIGPIYITNSLTLQESHPSYDYYDYKTFTDEVAYVKLIPLDLSLFGSDIVRNKFLKTNSLLTNDSCKITIIVPGDLVGLMVNEEEIDIEIDDYYDDGYITGYRNVVYGSTVSSDYDFYVESIELEETINLTSIDLFDSSFDKNINVRYENNGVILNKYTYYEYFLGDFFCIEEKFSVGDIVTDGINYAVVTNVVNDISIMRTQRGDDIFDNNPTYVIVGNLFYGHDAYIDNKQRYGVNRLYRGSMDDLNIAILVDFETNLVYNENYYYIYTENFLNKKEAIVNNDQAIVSVGDSIDILFKNSGHKLSIRDDGRLNIKIEGLPTEKPDESGILYTENGFIKIS